MVIGFEMQFSDVGIDCYNNVMKNLELESPGVEGVEKTGQRASSVMWRVRLISAGVSSTLWESQEKLDAFMQSRLGPAMGKAGCPNHR